MGSEDCVVLPVKTTRKGKSVLVRDEDTIIVGCCLSFNPYT